MLLPDKQTLYKINSFEWHFKDMVHLFLLYLPGTKKEIMMFLLEFLILACFLQQELIITIYPLYFHDRCPSFFSGIDSREESQCILLNKYSSAKYMLGTRNSHCTALFCMYHLKKSVLPLIVGELIIIMRKLR